MNISFSSKTYFILLLVLSILILWPNFLPGFFFHHDDLQVMRIYEMRQCFADLQVPCRWVPDMGYGNGFPLFNYYSALPYYIGGLLSYGLGLVNSAKALFFIPLLLGGISMFLLGQRLYGKDAGFLSGILYMFAPYKALDSYVRGAIAESFALAIIPFVFYYTLKIIDKPERSNIIFGSLSLGAFLLSHNIMTMFFTPFIVLWGLTFLLLQKWKNWKALLTSFVLGLGLSSFFLIPVFLEKNLVQADSLIQGGSDFRTHFVGVGQLLLDRSWGYGGSFFGPEDTISFQIGWPLWWFTVLILPLFLLNFRKDLKITAGVIFMLGMFGISVFMQHNKSAFIWEQIGTLQFAQFPWRLLSLSIFSASLLGGAFIYYLKPRLTFAAALVAAILTVWLNWGYFIPREFYPWINDVNKIQDPLWEIQQKAGILDYLPITAQEPQGRAPREIEVIEGVAVSNKYTSASDYFSGNVTVTERSYLQVPVFDFPNWELYVNGQKHQHDNKGPLGRISFYLEPGNYDIEGYFNNTPIRTISNLLTLGSVIGLILIFLNKKIQKLIF